MPSHAERDRELLLRDESFVQFFDIDDVAAVGDRPARPDKLAIEENLAANDVDGWRIDRIDDVDCARNSGASLRSSVGRGELGEQHQGDSDEHVEQRNEADRDDRRPSSLQEVARFQESRSGRLDEVSVSIAPRFASKEHHSLGRDVAKQLGSSAKSIGGWIGTFQRVVRRNTPCLIATTTRASELGTPISKASFGLCVANTPSFVERVENHGESPGRWPQASRSPESAWRSASRRPRLRSAAKAARRPPARRRSRSPVRPSRSKRLCTIALGPDRNSPVTSSTVRLALRRETLRSCSGTSARSSW
jgi:hypothetical protein